MTTRELERKNAFLNQIKNEIIDDYNSVNKYSNDTKVKQLFSPVKHRLNLYHECKMPCEVTCYKYLRKYLGINREDPNVKNINFKDLKQKVIKEFAISELKKITTFKYCSNSSINNDVPNGIFLVQKGYEDFAYIQLTKYFDDFFVSLFKGHKGILLFFVDKQKEEEFIENTKKFWVKDF